MRRRPASGYPAGLLVLLLIAFQAAAADGPNFLAEVSRAMVAAAIAESRDRPETVNDNIHGTRVTGGGQSHSEIGIEFVPSDRRAVLDLTLNGTAKTQTVGVTGPVRMYTNALTKFAGRKRIATDGERLELAPAVVRVRQDTELTNVGTRFAGPLDRVVSGVATRSFYREQDEANQESAQITERSIAQEFDRDASLQIAESERAYRRQQAELKRRGLWPQDLRISTTTDELRVRGTLTGVTAGGWALPPAVVGRPDAAVRIHESIFNNAAAKHYGGRTVSGDELDRDFTSVLGPQSPAGGRLDPQDREEFTVTFAEAPLTASFADGQVRAVVHTRGFTSDDRQITDPFDIRVAYDLTKTPTGLVLTRRELEVLPADVAAGKRRMSLRENSIAKMLSKRFDKLLPTKEDIALGDLPGGLRKLGRLLPTQADAASGWLALAWRRVP
jgi:hypothetical protein